MKKTIIVTTDFTESSRNALAYACSLVGDSDYKLLLLHVYTVPVTYTSDGVAMASIREAFDNAEDNVNDAVTRIKETFPAIEISGKTVMGGLIASLNEQINEHNPEMIIMGAAHDYADLWTWDSELLNALTDLPVPVLVVPRHISFAPIHNIGFASDYRNRFHPKQVDIIKRLVTYTHAQLHVVHVTRSKQEGDAIKRENERMLQDLNPKYHAIENPDVIGSVAHFVKEEKLDLLIVIPHKHDMWYSIFHQSHTKELARLNHMPTLALHD